MTVTKSTPQREWYIHNRLTDEYIHAHEMGGDLMLHKLLKIVRAIIVNLGMITVALFAIQQGADPTIIGGLGILSLGLYNGVEIMDYLSLLQAIQEVEVTTDQSDE